MSEQRQPTFSEALNINPYKAGFEAGLRRAAELMRKHDGESFEFILAQVERELGGDR